MPTCLLPENMRLALKVWGNGIACLKESGSGSLRNRLRNIYLPMKSLAPALALGSVLVSTLTARSADTPGDPAQGKVLFQQSCALCHATTLGPGGQPVSGQGPSLVGVVGRPAASLSNFNYSKALHGSGLVWDRAALDHFLEAPSAAVPGTTMPIPVPNADSRHDIIAYLATLVSRASLSPKDVVPRAEAGDPADWRHDSPGTKHSVNLADLPAPYATSSAGNGPRSSTGRTAPRSRSCRASR